MTEAGSIVGTAQYLSPEQARGTNVDQRSDVYSLGIVLYELLTGTVPFNGDTPVEIAMKHLSTLPEPPSAKRPEIPRDLDLIVTRALAKDPGDRYQSAEEMDADLERFLRGAAVSPVTEEAATQILRLPADGQPYAATAATMIASPSSRRTAVLPPPPPVYYDLDEPIHRRPMWPWFAVLFFVVVAAIGGFFLYSQISDKLASNAPVAVQNYLYITEALARQKIKDDGFAPVVNHHASKTTQPGLVFKQTPTAGHRQAKGSPVTVWVSTGLPRVAVPSVIDKSQTDAVATLTRAGLKVKTLEVPSSKQAGIVLAQDPPAETKVETGSTVHINISKGPQPVSVPSVVGLPIDQASSQLRALGFTVAVTPVDSNQAANTVISQSPPANQSVGKGSVINLTISKGPKTSTVPDVTSTDLASAESTLAASGFKWKSVKQEVTDPNLDGTVLTQTPAGGEQAKPGSTVTLTVGHVTQAAVPPPAPTTDTTTIP
jgi:serine/threonine-protein kinase